MPQTDYPTSAGQLHLDEDKVFAILTGLINVGYLSSDLRDAESAVESFQNVKKLDGLLDSVGISLTTETLPSTHAITFGADFMTKLAGEFLYAYAALKDWDIQSAYSHFAKIYGDPEEKTLWEDMQLPIFIVTTVLLAISTGGGGLIAEGSLLAMLAPVGLAGIQLTQFTIACNNFADGKLSLAGLAWEAFLAGLGTVGGAAGVGENVLIRALNSDLVDTSRVMGIIEDFISNPAVQLAVKAGDKLDKALYLQSSTVLANQLGITVGEAEKILASYLSTYSSVSAVMEDTRIPLAPGDEPLPGIDGYDEKNIDHVLKRIGYYVSAHPDIWEGSHYHSMNDIYKAYRDGNGAAAQDFLYNNFPEDLYGLADRVARAAIVDPSLVN